MNADAVDAELSRAEEAVTAAWLVVHHAADAYTASKSSIVLRDRLRAAEAALEAAESVRSEARARWKANAGPLVDLKVDTLRDAVDGHPGAALDRRKVNAAMRQCFRQVVVDFDDQMMRLEWAQGGTIDLEI